MHEMVISYRRDDTLAVAGRVCDHLRARFGDSAVLMDLDSIPAGVDFRAYLVRAVSRAAAVIAIIGPGWRSDAGGTARLEDPHDFVRVELETALAHGIPVVPLLVGNARMPSAPDLPVSLRELSFLNAIPVDPGRDFAHHVAGVIRALEPIVATGTPRAEPTPAATEFAQQRLAEAQKPEHVRAAAAARIVTRTWALRVFRAVLVVGAFFALVLGVRHGVTPNPRNAAQLAPSSHGPAQTPSPSAVKTSPPPTVAPALDELWDQHDFATPLDVPAEVFGLEEEPPLAKKLSGRYCAKSLSLYLGDRLSRMWRGVGWVKECSETLEQCERVAQTKQALADFACVRNPLAFFCVTAEEVTKIGLRVPREACFDTMMNCRLQALMCEPLRGCKLLADCTKRMLD